MELGFGVDRPALRLAGASHWLCGGLRFKKTCFIRSNMIRLIFEVRKLD